MMPSTSRIRVATPTPIYPADATLAEAEMELTHGQRALDSHLEERLEALSRNDDLPAIYRTRALSLLCRF